MVYKTHAPKEHLVKMQGQDDSFLSNINVDVQVAELHISSAEMTLLILVLLFQNQVRTNVKIL